MYMKGAGTRPRHVMKQDTPRLPQTTEQGLHYSDCARPACGPGQRFAIAIIEMCSRLTGRGDTLALRWVPSHPDTESAGDWARNLAESPKDAVFLRKTSFVYMTRMATRPRSAAVEKWLGDYVKSDRRHKLPKGSKTSKGAET